MENCKSAFVAGALSSASGKVRLEVFYEMIGNLCQQKNIKAFIPHRDASKEALSLDAKKLYNVNMQEIKTRDLIIAYVGLPSIGVGMEIQEACRNQKPIIILYEQKIPVSMPLMGCPGLWGEIIFSDFDDALSQLSVLLDRWIEKKS